MTFFKCGNKKCNMLIPMGTVDKPEPMYFKWKDNKKMVKQHVCFECWSKARTLKVAK